MKYCSRPLQSRYPFLLPEDKHTGGEMMDMSLSTQWKMPKKKNCCNNI
jgi:hypothetical protein